MVSSKSSSPNLMIYSSSPSDNSMWSSSFLTITPSSGLIALKTFKISSSSALVISTTSSPISPKSFMLPMSPKSSSDESFESMPLDSSSDESSSSSDLSSPVLSSASADTSSAGSSSGLGCSLTTSSSSSIDSFNKSPISCFIVEASIPFAFAFTASSRVCT